LHLIVFYVYRTQVAAKKPVLLEKPVALNVKELETMMAAAAENGVFIWVRRDAFCV
jgi:predicted dehydrogenase